MSWRVFNIFNLPLADPFPLPLITSPWPVICILLVYLLFVLKLGRIFMENREPYDVKKLMMVYNIVQIFYNACICCLAIYWLFINPMYDFQCMETLGLDHPEKIWERMTAYAYFINKILDLADTVFFIVRKSYKQITTLHVYHHVIMVLSTYMVERFYGPGGHFNVLGLLNSFVHAIMYFYYLLSSLYPQLKSSFWWKKYITIIQIIQFTILILHSLYVLLFSRNCGFPNSLLLMIIAQNSIIGFMFIKFYINTYIRPQKKKEE
ncbi:elongation of very long chain fatty acids protein F-like [Scaptodrosophila lebanonensis]|uniref:Elongation of very long chain fatty acids protein n=1 Tax=Drosophila lebanonensis TaxID=7225 RepID=A0A6J2T4C1_DROLE|nr:elongation of very long chain fatty acids protein F-like [Scaptodrosophila lebanonensis]